MIMGRKPYYKIVGYINIDGELNRVCISKQCPKYMRYILYFNLSHGRMNKINDLMKILNKYIDKIDIKIGCGRYRAEMGIYGDFDTIHKIINDLKESKLLIFRKEDVMRDIIRWHIRHLME